MLNDESLEEDMYSDSSEFYVAVKPQGGGIDSV